MDLELNQGSLRRRSLRRAVRLETDVVSNLWDGAVPLVATNLSLHGLWLDTELPLSLGEELIVSLMPPHWPGDAPLTALAEVARVGMFRRRREARRSGMGLRFLELNGDHELRLREALRGLPPPLPRRSQKATPPPLPELVRPSVAEVGRLPQVVLADGSVYTFRAEAPLLTAGRGPAPTAALIVSEPRLCAPVYRLTSPMSAILAGSHLRVAS